MRDQKKKTLRRSGVAAARPKSEQKRCRLHRPPPNVRNHKTIFQRSEAVTEIARPEKNHFGIQCRLSNMHNRRAIRFSEVVNGKCANRKTFCFLKDGWRNNCYEQLSVFVHHDFVSCKIRVYSCNHNWKVLMNLCAWRVSIDVPSNVVFSSYFRSVVFIIVLVKCRAMAELALSHVSAPPVAEDSSAREVAESNMTSATWFKWEVQIEADDYGNALWAEYPKHVMQALESMYSDVSTREDSFYLYVCQICLWLMPMLQIICSSLHVVGSSKRSVLNYNT